MSEREVKRYWCDVDRKDLEVKEVVLAADYDAERQRRVEAEEVLETISHGAGAFDRDPFQHARNCIEDMKSLARAHLARYKEET